MCTDEIFFFLFSFSLLKKTKRIKIILREVWLPGGQYSVLRTVTPSSDERYKSSTEAPMWSLWKVVHVPVLQRRIVLNFEQLRRDNFLAKILILYGNP